MPISLGQPINVEGECADYETEYHDKEKYLRGRECEIILFEASARALKAAGVGDKLPDLAKLCEEYSRLSEEKNRLYAEYCNCTKE